MLLWNTFKEESCWIFLDNENPFHSNRRNTTSARLPAPFPTAIDKTLFTETWRFKTFCLSRDNKCSLKLLISVLVGWLINSTLILMLEPSSTWLLKSCQQNKKATLLRLMSGPVGSFSITWFLAFSLSMEIPIHKSYKQYVRQSTLSRSNLSFHKNANN